MLAALLLLITNQSADERDPVWTGPGRFCGYASVIDLQEGEQLVPIEEAIHSASFRWSGPFGTVRVTELNWAVEPKGKRMGSLNGIQLLKVRLPEGKNSYALWDGHHLAVYVSGLSGDIGIASKTLSRITLDDHAGQVASDCKFRTAFSWE